MPSSSSRDVERRFLLAVNDVCFFFLGGSAWILVNGIYVQIPFIILFFDGDYGVVSKITLCVTLSALLPIFGSVSSFGSLTSANHVCSKLNVCNINAICASMGGTESTSGIDEHERSIHTGITLVLSLGFVTSLVLTIWTEQILSRLAPMLVASFAAGIVGTTSSILYYPHAASAVSSKTNTAKRQTTAMLFGTAVSNLFVALVAILQQQEQRQQISERAQATASMRSYFRLILVLMWFAIVGFLGTLVIRRFGDTTPKILESENNNKTQSALESLPLLEENYLQPGNTETILHRRSFQKAADVSLSFWEVSSLNSTLNTAQCALNFLVFFLPGIVPYSVRDSSKDENYNTTSLRYLVVSQLVAQTLGVLASSGAGGSSGARASFCYRRPDSDNNHSAAPYQLGFIFFFLWIPLVFLSFENDLECGAGIPIVLNALLNGAYGYCNTAWFHLLNDNHCGSQNGDTSNGTPTSAVRVMGTWHQIGATMGSAIAFELVEHLVFG